jgi:hypothetical protein
MQAVLLLLKSEELDWLVQLPAFLYSGQAVVALVG